jgi:hypothetical protein
MTRLVVRAVLAVALLSSSAACAKPSLVTSPNPRPFPTSAVPATVAGYLTRLEPRGAAAFDKVGSATGVQRGEVWTVLRDGVVIAAVQVAQLKGGLSTRKDVVRGGVRGAVGNGHFRWFKVDHKQWVGVQGGLGVRRYLWLPKRDDLYVHVQVKSDIADPLAIVSDLVSAQEDLS